jgi:hypothetical protein
MAGKMEETGHRRTKPTRLKRTYATGFALDFSRAALPPVAGLEILPATNDVTVHLRRRIEQRRAWGMGGPRSPCP